MSLTAPQTAWLSTLTGVAAQVEAFEQTEALKAQQRRAFDEMLEGSFGALRPELLETIEFVQLESEQPGARARYAAMPFGEVMAEAFQAKLSFQDATGKRVESALLVVDGGQSQEVDVTEIEREELANLSTQQQALLEVAMVLYGDLERAARRWRPSSSPRSGWPTPESSWPPAWSRPLSGRRR